MIALPASPKERQMRYRSHLAAVLLAVFAVAATPPLVSARPAPPPSHAGGAAFGDWLGRWWTQLVSLPVDRNPLAGTGDPCVPLSKKVIAPLLQPAGAPPLTCTVAPGTRVLALGSVAECSNVEAPPFFADTYADAVACAKAWSAPLTRHELLVDGQVTDLLHGGF